MIAQVNTVSRRGRFLRACRDVPCLSALLPAELAAFGKTQPGRFFAGPTVAIDLACNTAWVAGHANGEELASFLAICGVQRVRMTADPRFAPAGWQRVDILHAFSLTAGEQLLLPPADEALWAECSLNWQPAPGAVADFMYVGKPQTRRDDFYAELCAKRNHGCARVVTLERGGMVVGTVGAYGFWQGEAYMACGMTSEELRGRGAGGRMIVTLANALAAEGFTATFLAREERTHFYTRLGFAAHGTIAQYAAPTQAEP